MTIFLKPLYSHRRETRGDCPVCGYADSYTETTGRRGRIGWCASCQDREAIAAHLRGTGGTHTRAALITPHEAEAVTQAREQARMRALAIWSGAVRVTPNDPGGRYLARRGLVSLIASPALRYRADVSHPAGGRYPAMVALVQDATGAALGVHRTYLAPDGTKARVEPVKASLGPIWGGAIRLYPAAPEIVIGEGSETSASAGLLLGLPAWAAISAGNMATGLELPPEVRSIMIAADHDRPGIEAAETAAARWQAEGRKVRIIKPDTPGQDFNDLVMARMGEVMP